MERRESMAVLLENGAVACSSGVEDRFFLEREAFIKGKGNAKTAP